MGYHRRHLELSLAFPETGTFLLISDSYSGEPLLSGLLSSRGITRAMQLTTQRHVASFPPDTRIRREAPQFMPLVIRIAAVVLGCIDAAVRKHIIVNISMWVRNLGCPRLASFTAGRYSCVAHVLVSFRCRSALSDVCVQQICIRITQYRRSI